MTANVYLRPIKLTSDQRRHHDRLVLGVGDAYEYIFRRLYEAERDDEMLVFDHEFAAAPNLYAQVDVIQRWRQRLAAPTVRR